MSHVLATRGRAIIICARFRRLPGGGRAVPMTQEAGGPRFAVITKGDTEERTMRILLRSMLLFLCGSLACTGAAEKLVLEMNMDEDLLSLTHHIEGFPFKPTLNFSTDLAGNLSERIKVDPLKSHLAVTILVRIDGEVAGFATEQEAVLTDPATGALYAESAWLFTLQHPRASGFLAVKQRENAAPTFALVQKVMDNPGAGWTDEEHRFLSTDGLTRVQLATGGLSAYQGGRFEEYNFVTPSELKRFGRFRAKIEFVIYPAE
ncbi:MAG: hypothetical protein HYR49_04615 [Gammaproteobacteria bacterium]|nr:hypothetical protein [Gammaproteobacteria bacterium]